MNCIHCGRSGRPVESYTFSCDTPSQEFELALCPDCLGEIRLDPTLKLVSTGTQSH